jgi:O-antigen/teichoic acid export membrane protein
LGMQSTFAIVLQLVQDTKALAVSQGVAAIVYIPLVVFFVTRWGLLGGALVTLLGYAMSMALTFGLLWRYQRLDIPVMQSAKAVIAAFGMGILIWYFRLPGLRGLALALAIGIPAYGGLLFLLGGVGRRELHFVGSILAKRSDEASPDRD